jgi:opacity protein-like surface antigen
MVKTTTIIAGCLAALLGAASAADGVQNIAGKTVHALNQSHEDVVTVYFYNRADHTRQVAISVDYSSR